MLMNGPRSRVIWPFLMLTDVLLEFPSREAFEGFYSSPAYQDLHAMRDEVSYARLVGVEGLASPGAAAAATLAPAPTTG